MKEKKYLKEINQIIQMRKDTEQRKIEEKEQKRNEILNRIGKLKEDRVHAKQQMRHWSQKRITDVPLYLKKETEFERQQREVEEQKRQSEMQYRKNVFKRISISEIRKHAKMHDSKVEESVSMLRRKRLQNTPLESDARDGNATPTGYSSKFLVNTIEQEKKMKILRNLKEKEAKHKRDKANKFSKIVQEIYWSKERKQAEKKLKDEMELRKLKNHLKEPETPTKSKAEDYLHYYSQNTSTKKPSQKHRQKTKTPTRTINPSLNTSSSQPSKPPLRDYLKESRQKRLRNLKEQPSSRT